MKKESLLHKVAPRAKVVTVKRQIVIKDCQKDFGIGPGLLLEDTIEYRVPTNPSPTELNILASQAYRDGQELLEKHIDVIITQLPE